MKRIYLIVLTFLLLFMVACNAPGNATNGSVTGLEPEATAVSQPTQNENEVVEEADPTSCPEATVDMALLQDAAHGFCLLYPANYQVVATGENSISIVKDSLLNVTAPLLSMDIMTAGDQTATDAADALMAQFPAELLEGLNVEHHTVTVAGVEAEVINNLPGQDTNRQLFMVHEGLLYHFFFTPVDGEGNLDQFSNNLLASFQFIPVVADAPLQAGPECPTLRADTQLYRNEADGYCLLIPADFIAEETAPHNSVIYFGSLMDVEHPKLFINVVESDGRSTTEITDEIAAGLTDFAVERTFGLLVDGEWAEQLDKVPGQDLNRQVIFIHNGRLYTLTFVPDDATAGTVYEQMEAMYELTLKSFGFLQQ